MPAIDTGPYKPKKVRKKRKTSKPPTATQRARAQERAYGSQGRSVEKTANRQKAVAKRGRSDAAQGGGTRDAVAFKKTPQYRSDKKAARRARLIREVQDPRKLHVSSLQAPVLKVLDQTTRPVHAVAAGTDAAFHGRNVPKAALAGIENKDKTTFSNVLRNIGAPKVVSSVGGFALDVAADPTTYVTGGAGAVAKKAAEKAAVDASKKALAKGLTKEQAAKFGERAAKQAEKTAAPGKGVTVKVAGKEVPGVRRASAKAGRGAKRVVRKTTPERARTGVRSAVADVNPNTVATGATREESTAAIRATRTARAKTNRGLDQAQKQAVAIKRQVGEENYAKVIDALEAGDLAKLSPELAAVAHRVRSRFKHANRLRKQAGIKGGERKNYVPHQLTEKTLEVEGKKVGGVGSKVIRPSSSKARKEQRSLAELRKAEPGRYSEDLPTLYANRLAEGHKSVAKAELNRRLAAQGKPVKKGMDLPDGKGTHAVFQIKGSDIRELTDPKEIEQLATRGGKSGQYVVLNKDIVKRATEGVSPQLQGPGIVKALDKAQGGFKRIAIATPGFHLRNLVGDTQNAYLGQGGHRLPGNLRRSAKVLKAAGRQDKANLNLAQVKAGKGTVKTKRYGEITYDEIAKRFAEHGGYRTGYTAKEIPELARSGEKGVKVKRAIVPQWLKRAGLNREDLPRVATGIEALRKGATWEEAASKVADYHFDYQHLTSFERNVARRAAPFYTFSARNIPLQTKSLVTKPGKFAQYQKLREEAAKATGVDEQNAKTRAMYDQLKQAGVKLPKGWEKQLTEWEQRYAGVPVSWKGAKFTVSMGLPLTDLSEVPGAAGKRQLDEYYQKMMSLATPIGKDPIEYFENHSFFFRDQIERDYSPNVAAPSYVGKFPAKLRKELKIVKGLDKKSGEMVWKWPGKMDYLAKAVPGSPAFVQKMLTGGADRAGKGKPEQILGFAGAKVTPIDPMKTVTGLAYERQQELMKRLAVVRDQGFGKDNPSPEWRKLNAQLKIVKQIVYQAKQAGGYKVLPTAGGPKKLKASSGGVDWGTSSGGGVDWGD